MLTGELRNKVDSLWEIFWTGGLANPLDVIEQMTYLMFIHDLDANDNLRATFNSYLTASELNQGNLFAYIVPVTAYSESGSDWLEQVCSYISDNIDFVDKYLTENMPIIKFIRPMASFLIFLDCRELNLSQPELENLFIEKAGLALNTGTMFGPEGKGFMRMNIATSRATIKEALDRIKAAIE